MKESFDISLLASGEIMKRGYTALINNIGKAIATITLVVTTLVLFTDISFAEFSSKSFSSTLAVMTVASCIMYFSMEEAGEKLGEDSEEYKSAVEKYTSLTDKINGSEITKIREFLESYTEEELKYRRNSLLFYYGCSEDDYNRYLSSGRAESKELKRIFKKADRLRAVSITPRTLTSKERTKDESELKNPESTKLLRLCLRLIPCIISMCVTVSVMLSAKSELNAGVIIDGLLKLSALPVIGFKGYSAGYNYTRGATCLWIKTKISLMEAYLSTRENATL